VRGPSVEPCPGEMWTDLQGSQPHTAPRAMTAAHIAAAVGEYVQAARLAMEAGFDGVELHAANGYLLEQFLNANINRRQDGYGGSPEGRNRLVLEVAAAVAQAIGAERVGIRLSPYGVFNGAGEFPGVDGQYLALVKGLSSLGLMYAHVLDHSALGAPAVPESLKAGLREAFKGPFILAGGFDKAQAEQALTNGRADLVAMGRPFLANPDLVERLRQGSPLNAPDPQTFYTPGEKGYTDYPALQV
jgi:N-ethylmaleimide reductase